MSKTITLKQWMKANEFSKYMRKEVKLHKITIKIILKSNLSELKNLTKQCIFSTNERAKFLRACQLLQKNPLGIDLDSPKKKQNGSDSLIHINKKTKINNNNNNSSSTSRNNRVKTLV